MKVAVITANMGSIDGSQKWIEQTVPADYYVFNDSNFPLRYNALTPRLQARIPKMFSWQMVPGYDVYIWFDHSLVISSNRVVEWFLEKLGDYDAVFLRHPNRSSVKAEGEFIKQKIAEKDYYLTPRYLNELVDEEIAEICADKDYNDDMLLASTTFACRNNEKVHSLMKEWWYHTSRYHIVDQLGLPYAIYKSQAKVNIIDENYRYLEHLKHSRKTFYKTIWRGRNGKVVKSVRPVSNYTG